MFVFWPPKTVAASRPASRADVVEGEAGGWRLLAQARRRAQDAAQQADEDAARLQSARPRRQVGRQPVRLREVPRGLARARPPCARASASW